MPIGNPDQSEKMSVSDGLLFNYMMRERERERERVTCLSFLKQPSSKCFSQTMFCFEYLYVLISRFLSQDCGSTVDRVVCSSLDLVWQRHLFPDPASHYKIWLYTVAFLYTYLSILH